jgi:hypothetical protein
MMRAWENRPDTTVCDEPLYAHYLQETGVAHPGRDEVIASQSTDWHEVVAWLTGPVPGGKEIFYQKHMAHHMLPHIDREWLSRVTNVFLIRDPREMLTSLLAVTPRAGLDDTGLPQQWEMFEQMREETGQVPAVIDARDVLEDPRGVLEALCAAVGVPFSEEMLAWPPGPRETDGVWAKHWYAEVERSTGFAPYRRKRPPVPDSHADVLARCEAYYERLHEQRLRARR